MCVMCFLFMLLSCFLLCCHVDSNLGLSFEITNKTMHVVSRLPRTDASLTPFLGLFLSWIRRFRKFCIVFFTFFRFLDAMEAAHCELDVVIWIVFIHMAYANILSLYVSNKGLSGPMVISNIIIEKFGKYQDGVYGWLEL